MKTNDGPVLKSEVWKRCLKTLDFPNQIHDMSHSFPLKGAA
jgi:hypothetical protein